MNVVEQIAFAVKISNDQVKNTLALLKDSATVPFIARYRKEATQGLDEIQIGKVWDEYERFLVIEKRKQSIIKGIDDQGSLTDELKDRIIATFELNVLEDIYLPYKKKRKTKASIARENGLEGLAKIMMSQDGGDLQLTAKKYITSTVSDIESVLEGARFIIAEWISENRRVRNNLRKHFRRNALITTTVKKGEAEKGEKFKDYFNYSEPINKCRSHRILAMRRGEQLGILNMSVVPEESESIAIIQQVILKGESTSAPQINLAITDSYKRLIKPSLENELKKESKEKADTEAIDVFVKNLRQLLLAPPLGQKRILALDPGFRSGCKLVCLNQHGDLLHNENIYPHPPQNEKGKAMSKIANLVSTYKLDAIAIGNGTASRETEALVKKIKFDRSLQVFIVSEDGASIYSASKVAREEFPQFDVTVRGAISIGRRLMDPLSELVKIDPKNIGIGQYQHDVDEKLLKKSLDAVVESCVNSIGVDVNTASKYLLTYVSGVGPVLAENIVSYREENGTFNDRKELLKVPRMGDKVYEQCAGFLRVLNGVNPLDNSAVHPERYQLVKEISKDCGISVESLIGNDDLLGKVKMQEYVCDEVGLPTIQDIIEELSKPGRDPRQKAKVFEFSKLIRKIEDVKLGMRLPGIVTNITNFGCFVDIGVKQDGLLHISNMADRFISDPNTVVSLHEHIEVEVLEVDIPRSRIGFRLLLK